MTGAPRSCRLKAGETRPGRNAGGTPTLPGDPEALRAAWAEYYEWLHEQDWGPSSELTGAKQFQLMVDKLHELGLPVRNARS